MYKNLPTSITNKKDNKKANTKISPYFKETGIKFLYSPLSPTVILSGEPIKEIQYTQENGYHIASLDSFFNLFDSISLVITKGDSEQSLFIKNCWIYLKIF
ncbi:MAG TPA: hypothetical protein PK894_04895 [Defluviitoga sp.]|nr:hypothetical protein [Defluviitoga sp.]HOP24541.1 hypothetical protein [Defluviitoga sp.]HPZ29510.1 hypothetical protein [Defluviitoga sp.]HQD62917.1 hypothetical protein [Defluviitoga sp.]